MFLRTRLPELRRSRSVSDVPRRRPKEWQARAVVTTCALILALADAGPHGGVRAQQAPPAAGQPTFRTEANFILTDVFVTKDGQPVTDLKVDDFEVREDGALQTIKSFEYVHITRGMTSGRREPSTVAESAAAASDPRRRVFVLFLDTFHVSRASSMVVRKTLMNFVQTMLGPDDLVALVTPQMGGSDLSFSSRPDSILGYFENNPVWGVADELPGAESDEVEKNLSGCVSGDWLRLRARLREKRTFQAMRDMVRYLDGLRESRKAIVMVSEGWSLYRANDRVLKDPTRPGHAPGRPVIGVGPDGRLGDQSGRNRTGSASPYDCDTLRAELSNLDTSEQFRNDIIGEANRANASYYTIDAEGLRAGVQTPIISTDPVVGLAQARNPDREPFSTPLQTLRTLGPATNGLAITDSNDFSGGLRRVLDDFNSFYLLGYNSSNSRLDGKYRKIAVKVKRPGVEVRSREGYTAGSPESTRAAPPSGPAATPASDAETMVTAALSRIAPARAGVPFLLYAAAGGAGPDAIVRVVAELEGALVQTPDWREGGEATVTVRNGAGATLGSAVSKFAPGERIIRIDVPMAEGGAASGDLRVQVRVTGTGALARFTDATNVKVDAATPRWGAPLVLRRGPTTGTAYVPTADLRFRRQERVRVELPSPRDSVTATLVDRRGKPMEIPVRVDAATPEHALTADVSLAPLAAGDYAIVLTVGDIHLAVPIRVIP
jgi:VWFA-related protein